MLTSCVPCGKLRASIPSIIRAPEPPGSRSRMRKPGQSPRSGELKCDDEAIVLLVMLGRREPVSPLGRPERQRSKSVLRFGDGADKNPSQEDNAPIPAVERASSPDDVIGAEDTLSITCLESDDITKTWRVSSTGDVNLPLVGQIHAAGLTAEAFNDQLREQLKRYIHEPHVTVYIADFRSQPVTVTGAVHRPGRVPNCRLEDPFVRSDDGRRIGPPSGRQCCR